ncbi:MAG: hypothetical protein JW908_06940 [Anaerolineales bacterium]|nr:hypothetical protein [Anaerolineales bacterium]
MSQIYNRGDFQRRIVQLLNYEDGLWDIMLGLIFLALGVFPLTRKLLGPSVNFILYLAYLAIIVIVLQYTRRVISTPRIGIVKNLKSKARMILVTVMILLLLMTLIFVIITFTSDHTLPLPSESTNSQEGTDYRVDIIMGLAVIGIFSAMGFIFGIRRLHLYGVLLGLGNLASTVLRYEYGFPFNLPLVIASCIIIFLGAVLLYRFLRKYPIRSDEATYGRR